MCSDIVEAQYRYAVLICFGNSYEIIQPYRMLILVCSTISNIRLTNDFPNGLYNLSEGRRDFIAGLFLGIPLQGALLWDTGDSLTGLLLSVPMRFRCTGNSGGCC